MQLRGRGTRKDVSSVVKREKYYRPPTDYGLESPTLLAAGFRRRVLEAGPATFSARHL
jgi:hypothetical protein